MHHIARMFIVCFQMLYCCRHYHLHLPRPCCLVTCLHAILIDATETKTENFFFFFEIISSTALLKHSLQVASLFMHTYGYI
jgi:hypothetical protein